MGTRISQLPQTTTPYTGAEFAPLVQNGETRYGTLSSVASYTNTSLKALSGNFAVKNSDNNFTTGQTINGDLITYNVTLSGGLNPLDFSLKRGWSGQSSFCITDHNTVGGDYTIAFGQNNCGYLGESGSASDVIAIGRDSMFASAMDSGTSADIVAIGRGSGITSSSSGGEVLDLIAIGQNSAYSICNSGGIARNLISIGKYSAANAAINGLAEDVILIGQNSGANDSANSGFGRDGSATSVIGIGYGSCVDLAYAGSASYIISLGDTSGYGMGVNGIVENVIVFGTGSGAEMGAVGGTAIQTISIGLVCGTQMGWGGSVSNIINIGSGSGNYLGREGSVSDVVALGSGASLWLGANGGYAQNIISLGTNSCSNLANGGQTNNIIAIGKDSGSDAGNSATAQVANSIFIGLSSGARQYAPKNTFVGDYTNTTSPENTSLSGCIALGYGAQPSTRNTIAIGSASVPLSVIPGQSLGTSLSGLKIMINGKYYTIPLLA